MVKLWQCQAVNVVQQACHHDQVSENYDIQAKGNDCKEKLHMKYSHIWALVYQAQLLHHMCYFFMSLHLYLKIKDQHKSATIVNLSIFFDTSDVSSNSFVA